MEVNTAIKWKSFGKLNACLCRNTDVSFCIINNQTLKRGFWQKEVVSYNFMYDCTNKYYI